MKSNFKMRPSLWVAVVASFGIANGVGFKILSSSAQAQSKPNRFLNSSAADDEWNTQMLIARSRSTSSEEYRQGLQKAVGNRFRTNEIAGYGASNSEGTEMAAFGLLQNQRLIEQNDEIIRLLKAQKK